MGLERILFYKKFYACLLLLHCMEGTQVDSFSPNIYTTPITAMGCRQCLPPSVVHLKGKHCRKPHCHNRVVDTFGPRSNRFVVQNCTIDFGQYLEIMVSVVGAREKIHLGSPPGLLPSSKLGWHAINYVSRFLDNSCE